jgi:diguanylate cyclase (GGDEF)-like protein/PAS domain S-box-containing protein
MEDRTLYENLPSIYFTLNLVGKILTVSQFGATQLGYRVEALINQSIFGLVHDDDGDKLKQAISLEGMAGGVSSIMPAATKTLHQHRVSCQDGTILWVKAIAALIPNTEPNPEIFLVWEIDHSIKANTKQKPTETALQESREKYRILFQTFPIGIAITDETGKITEANPASEKILGISIEEHTQRRSDAKQWQIIRPDGTLMPVEEYASVRALKENRIIKNIEQGIVKTGQETTWMSVTASPIILANYGVAIAYIDITERKQIEESFRHSEERYRQLFNSGYDAIFVHSFTENKTPTQFTTVNDIACQMLGYSRNELLQLSPLDISASEKITEILTIMDKLIAKKHLLFEIDLLTKDKQEIIVEINANFFDLNGQPTVLSIVRDIRERKQAEAALQQQYLRERLMGAIQSRIRKSLKLSEILNTTVTEVRQFLQTDRVIIYQFETDCTGVVVVEALEPQWQPMLGRKILDTCLARELDLRPYTQGYIQAVEDIYNAGFPQCYVDLLAEFQVRANLVVPILQGEALWGLLVAQHCRQTRQWQPWEIELLNQLAINVGIAIQQAELYQQLEAANQQLNRLATLDGLTQLANRRRFDQYLEQEWRRLTRESQPLSLILCDVDFFKLYNDTYGHQAGDEALKQVAAALGSAVKRPADLVARYGGEEFALVLPNTHQEGALHIAESIHKAIKLLKLVHRSSSVNSYLTLSIGVACVIPRPDTSATALVAAADAGLYQAKGTGRDRTVVL